MSDIRRALERIADDERLKGTEWEKLARTALASPSTQPPRSGADAPTESESDDMVEVSAAIEAGRRWSVEMRRSAKTMADIGEATAAQGNAEVADTIDALVAALDSGEPMAWYRVDPGPPRTVRLTTCPYNGADLESGWTPLYERSSDTPIHVVAPQSSDDTPAHSDAPPGYEEQAIPWGEVEQAIGKEHLPRLERLAAGRNKHVLFLISLVTDLAKKSVRAHAAGEREAITCTECGGDIATCAGARIKCCPDCKHPGKAVAQIRALTKGDQ